MTNNQGRKTIIDQKLISQIKELKEKGISINKISIKIGVSRSTIYKVLKNHLGYQSQFKLTNNLK